MSKKTATPLIDVDGEAREPTPEEWRWAVHGRDFNGVQAVQEFLSVRKVFLRNAKALGFEPEMFLAFDPCKPGFVERAEGALAALLTKSKASRHAAE